MEEVKSHKLFWPLVIVSLLTLNIVVNTLIITRQVRVELKKMQSSYGPSKNGPALDYDRLEGPDLTIWDR